MQKKIVMKNDGFSESADNGNPIQLENCPNGGLNCKDQLHELNRRLINKKIMLISKNYSHAIIELKNAFYFTFSLNNGICKKCAGLFRSHVIISLEEIKNDLESMTRGIFRRKRYVHDLEFANQILFELKKEIEDQDIKMAG